jgi:putative hydrolase of the HAD superfamily
MEPVRAVLFDYGHTLVDFHRTEEALQAAYEQIRARIEAVAYMEVPEILDLIERVARGVDLMVRESYEAHRLEELDPAELFREALAGIGFDLPPDVIDHIVALDHSSFSNSIMVGPAVVRLLSDLRDERYRLGLVSNVSLRPDLMRADLDRLGIGPLLHGSVFSSEIGTRKPDPQIFQEALRRIGAGPEGTVFVGDRLYDDIGGAQAAGMRAVQTMQFRHEQDPEARPDAVIADLSELPRTLREWGGPPGPRARGRPRRPARSTAGHVARGGPREADSNTAG